MRTNKQIICNTSCKTCPLRGSKDPEQRKFGVQMLATLEHEETTSDELRQICGNIEGETFPLRLSDPKTAAGACAAKIILGSCSQFAPDSETGIILTNDTFLDRDRLPDGLLELSSDLDEIQLELRERGL